MNKKTITRILGALAITVSIAGVSPISANAEWRQDTTGWWYADGDFWAIGWRNIDNKWYYFGQDGYMKANTVIDGNTIGNDGAITKMGVGTLTKADFDFKGTDSTNQLNGCKNIVDWFYSNDYVYGWGCYINEKDSEFGKEESKTEKGIGIDSTLKEVIEKYGETEIKPVSTEDTFYKYAEWKSNPEKKYVMYSYYEGIRQFNIRFYFDGSDKVVYIAYTVNESSFPQDVSLAEQITQQYRSSIVKLNNN